MRAEIEIKSRDNGKWDHIRTGDVYGTTLSDAVRGFDGKDVVVEVILNGAKSYFCGTSDLCQLMAKKGRSILCVYGTEELTRLSPALPAVKLLCDLIERTFIAEGSQLEKVVTELPDPVEPRQTEMF